MDTSAAIVAPSPIRETRELAPLLPPVLVRPAALFWLWVTPVAAMLLLNVQGFWIIEGNMDDEERGRALVLGIAGLANLLLGVAAFVASRKQCAAPTSRGARLPAWSLAGIMIATQLAYLWLAMDSAHRVLPDNVVTWIYPPERYFFNQFAFAMLPLALGVLRLACLQPPQDTGKAIVTHVVIAVGAPIVLYIAFTTLASRGSLHRATSTALAVTVVLLGLVMFFGIIRTLMLALRRAQRWSSAGERVAIVAFALVLPTSGLLLNRSIPFPVDFQAWEVYALVAANTVILLFASWSHAVRPRLSFGLLCATLPFSLYFFVVFLPYTPLSILAVIALGTGFLVLTPTFLFALHLHLLNKVWRNPHLPAARRNVLVGGVAAFSVLPAFFTVRGLADRSALNAALDHVYEPTIEGDAIRYPGSRANLRRALASHRSYKNGLYYPLLSDYYAWLVFDNLVLPDNKLAHLDEIFFGRIGSWDDRAAARARGVDIFGGRSSVRDRRLMPRAAPPPRSVAVRQIAVSTQDVDDHDTVVSLALTLENTDAASRLGAEFVKTLPLPAGVFVSGFRLHIEGTPVPGRIFEKKTAMWVYTMIRDSERRDPGLLFYTKPDELELRVFPVNAGKPVTVEVDFLAPGKVGALPESDDPAVMLAALSPYLESRMAHDAGATAVALGREAAAPPTVDREPFLHLVIDRSQDNAFTGDIGAAVRMLEERFPRARRARVTLANHEAVEFTRALTPLNEIATLDEPRRAETLRVSGGFASDLALAHALRLHRDLDLDSPDATNAVPPRPIFVILSQTATPRLLALDIASTWADVVPELEIHELGADGSFATHRAADSTTRPLLRLGQSIRPLSRAGTARFDGASDKATLEYWSPGSGDWEPVGGVSASPHSTRWAKAIALQLAQQDHARSPGGAGVDLKSLVAASRSSGVLLASTSYIVVENQAQWRMLQLGEHAKLGQNTALEFLETPTPSALLVFVAFGLWLLARRVWRTSVASGQSCRA